VNVFEFFQYRRRKKDAAIEMSQYVDLPDQDEVRES